MKEYKFKKSGGGSSGRLKDGQGRKEGVFFSSEDIDYWYAANHDGIDDLFEMQDVVNLAQNVAKGGGSKAFMESALLEIFLEMRRKGISQQVAKKKLEEELLLFLNILIKQNTMTLQVTKQ